jgi:5-methylcytosine-specific restriction endonuclease McrA
MRKVLLKKIEEQGGICALCELPFESLIGIAPDHIKPKGMNSARGDDRAENIQATHSHCNYAKGSKRLPDKSEGAAA